METAPAPRPPSQGRPPRQIWGSGAAETPTSQGARAAAPRSCRLRHRDGAEAGLRWHLSENSGPSFYPFFARNSEQGLRGSWGSPGADPMLGSPPTRLPGLCRGLLLPNPLSSPMARPRAPHRGKLRTEHSPVTPSFALGLLMGFPWATPRPLPPPLPSPEQGSFPRTDPSLLRVTKFGLLQACNAWSWVRCLGHPHIPSEMRSAAVCSLPRTNVEMRTQKHHQVRCRWPAESGLDLESLGSL